MTRRTKVFQGQETMELDKASGKYLLFIDPDDYVDHDSFSRILKTTSDKNAQVSFLGFSFLNEDGSLRNTYFQSAYSGNVFSGTEAYLHARGDGRTDPDRMWAVLYEREFIIKNDLRFLPNVPYLEDGELIARILCLAERCIFEGHSFYQRTTRPGSATRSNLILSDKAINGFILAAQNLKEFQGSDNLTAEQKEFLNQSICKFTLTGLISISSLKYFSRFRANVKLLRKANLKYCPLKKCNNYYYIEGSLYNISPYLFFIHRLLNAPLLRLVRP